MGSSPSPFDLFFKQVRQWLDCQCVILAELMQVIRKSKELAQVLHTARYWPFLDRPDFLRVCSNAIAANEATQYWDLRGSKYALFQVAV